MAVIPALRSQKQDQEFRVILQAPGQSELPEKPVSKMKKKNKNQKHLLQIRQVF